MAEKLEAPPELRADLSEAERRLLEAAPRGKVAICGPNFNEVDPANDPHNADSWGGEREIRAELIRWLCTDPETVKRIDPLGVRAYGAKVTGDLNLGFVSVAFPIRLVHCRVEKDCDLSYMKVALLDLLGSTSRAIQAAGIEVRGDVFLNDGFSAEGEVGISGAQIGGELVCSRGSFKNPEGYALNADSAEITRAVFLDEGFSAEGEINLAGARIGGTLECAGGSFKSPGRDALIANRADIKGSVFLSETERRDSTPKQRFSAIGEVNFIGARIAGNLVCDGGIFSNPKGYAFTAETIEITRNAFLSDGFRADGWVDLTGARIGGSLHLWGWERGNGVAKLDLRNARAAAIWDDDASWPDQGNLELDGFVYDRISSAKDLRSAKKRIEWIERQSEFTSQPYRQLAKVLQEIGDDDGHQEVLYALEKRTRTEGRQSMRLARRWLHFGWDTMLDGAVGDGIYPERAGWLLAGLAGLGWLVHWRAQRMKAMAPTEKEAYQEFHESGQPPKRYPRFNPFIYALENCAPLVKFGQDDHWQADPNPARLEKPDPAKAFKEKVRNFALRVDRAVTSPLALRWFRWIMIALGWLLATFFVAGVSGIIKTH